MMARNLSYLHPANTAPLLTHILWATILLTSFLVCPSTAKPAIVAQTTTAAADADHMIPITSSATDSNETYINYWALKKRFRVNVTNGISGATVKVHCRSYKHDLGMHVLSPWQGFNWSIYQKDGTYVYCHFYWSTKDASLFVFSSELRKTFRGPIFYWKASEKGIIFSKYSDFGDPVLMATWKNIS